jgi:hypothetical protein
MTTTETDPLLAAVEALTKPQRRKQVQDVMQPYTVEDEDGVITQHHRAIGTQKVTVEIPPLLELLDSSIQSSMGGSTKGAALASESIPLNSAALFEAMKIADTVRDWCRQAKVVPSKHTAKDLQAWLASTFARDLTEDTATLYVTLCRRWAGTIKGLLDPMDEKDLPDPCPVCGATVWWDAAEDRPQGHRRHLPPLEDIIPGRPRPLAIRYKRGDPDMIENGYGFCRACGEVFGVRELRYAIEHAGEATA